MFRTSLYLPLALHQRLKVASKQQSKPLSRLVGELLDKALTSSEATRLQQMYAGLRGQGGFGAKGVTDGSATINAVLYGDRGTWKGRGE